jgi:hypothetical protein
MKYLLLKIIPYTPLTLVILAYIACIGLLTVTEPRLSKKDCTIAEISPDFSVKEKELCRKLK